MRANERESARESETVCLFLINVCIYMSTHAHSIYILNIKFTKYLLIISLLILLFLLFLIIILLLCHSYSSYVPRRNCSEEYVLPLLDLACRWAKENERR